MLKSEAQRRWLHANKPELAKEWELKTSDKKLPEKVQKPQKNIRKVKKI